MKFRTATRVPGSNQSVDLELEDSDMQDLPGWGEKSLSEKFSTMSKRADLMIVNYLFKNGHISQEYAEQRVREIQGA